MEDYIPSTDEESSSAINHRAVQTVDLVITIGKNIFLLPLKRLSGINHSSVQTVNLVSKMKKIIFLLPLKRLSSSH